MSGETPIEDDPNQSVSVNEDNSRNELVVRSAVPQGQSYSKYRTYLRNDFFFCCAYCTMSESEAMAIRMTIDHYEPRRARPDLENAYDNLMYACDECNTRKGDRSPPDEARRNGYRVFRPDVDLRSDHFELRGLLVRSATNTGNYTIEALDLNRAALRRLRAVRERLTSCQEFVNQGVMGLRSAHIDLLPQSMKGRAAKGIQDAIKMREQIEEKIDELLKDYARSPLIDESPGDEPRLRARGERLSEMEALFPGKWRATGR